jgi:uncharacterized protein (DUF1697 family)
MKYTALFRGINVGGKNIVKMAALEQLFFDLGIYTVKTYIQSGNIIFETSLAETALLEKIKTGFEERFGFKSNVIVRNAEEWKYLIEQLPFTNEEVMEAEAADPQVEHLYVYFLDDFPEQTAIDAIRKDYTGTDKIRAGRKELYFLCSQSVRNSKLAVRISKEFESATVRNWKTVSKLYDMLTSI